MFARMLRPLSLCGAVWLCATGTIASAQWLPADSCGACAAPPAACAPVCAQPVACYQTVPVTEYREVRQTVRRPICETKYIDQPCTEYRPVVEQCTVNVPTVTYEDVVECRPVCRDAGAWVTRYTPVCKMSPCAYDGRPGLVGWLNRTAYSVRSSFTPNVLAHNEYVPNVITQNVAVRRRVAKQGVRQVSYNVTRMVAQTTTRKVAVNTVRYVDEQVVAMQPVTVMRTVPIGTALAFGGPAYGAPSRTALGPQPDPVSSVPLRRADASDNPFRDRPAPEPRSAAPAGPAATPRPDAPRPRDGNDPFSPTSFERRTDRPVLENAHDHDHGTPATGNGAALGEEEVIRSRAAVDTIRPHYAARPVTSAEPIAHAAPSRSVPSIVRVGQWTARRQAASDSAPSLAAPSIAAAGR